MRPSPLPFLVPPLLLAACSSTPEVLERGSQTAPEEVPVYAPRTFDYLVGPRDVLRVNVLGHPELSSAPYKPNTPGSPVDAQGRIQLPLVGSVEVAGKNLQQIREDLLARLGEYLKHPQVDVAMVEFGAYRYYIVGEVNQPGVFVLDRPLTVLEALSRAGGYTRFAYRDEVALVHGPVAEENITLFSTDDLDPLTNRYIQPDDIIFVGRRSWAEVAEVAQDLVPLMQAIFLPVSTARDIAIIQDIRSN